jgi:hypothetical protein
MVEKMMGGQLPITADKGKSEISFYPPTVKQRKYQKFINNSVVAIRDHV